MRVELTFYGSQPIVLPLDDLHHIAENVGFEPTHGFPWLRVSTPTHYRTLPIFQVRKPRLELGLSRLSDERVHQLHYSRIKLLK